jgi:hypothetical protein
MLFGNLESSPHTLSHALGGVRRGTSFWIRLILYVFFCFFQRLLKQSLHNLKKTKQNPQQILKIPYKT